MSSSPIADLSYRSYDGELESPSRRWWVVARQIFFSAIRRRAIWIWMAFSGWYYLAMISVIYFTEKFSASTSQAMGTRGSAPVDPFSQYMSRIVWKDQFIHGLSFGQIWFMIITLIVGVGTIANDNRANALLVYLSKPCDKRDYLFGKWFGVFLVLCVTSAAPSLLFYLYGVMNYRSYGFLASDQLLIFKLLFLVVCQSAYYASIAIGISSLFNQGRLAGATLAAVYFVSSFFSTAFQIAWFNLKKDNAAPGLVDMVGNLIFVSVDGLNIGLFKSTFATSGSTPFGIPNRDPLVSPPPLLAVLFLMALVSSVAMFVAWKRIRAVEVVG